MLQLVPLLLVLAQAPDRATTRSPDPAPDTSLAPAGARNPAYSPDGRLALAVRGDLWVQSTAGERADWVRTTSGLAWDREPAWTADGSAIVFSSNRSGDFDLWRVRVGADGGAVGEPDRLTTAPEDEGEPAIASDGRILFVLGRGHGARIWVRAPDGALTRLTAGGGAAERWPSISPDGKRVAYATVTEGERQLVVRSIDGGQPEAIIADRAAEHPAWSPDGARIAFTSGGGDGGVFVTPVSGAWVNFVADRHAEPAWAPDGRMLALVDVPPSGPGYNGDPDRLGDRDAQDMFPDVGRLWFVSAPSLGELRAADVPNPARVDRPAYNAERFDRVWERTARLYYASGADGRARRAQWTALRDQHRPRALAATSDTELDDAIHAMLRERPPTREGATGRAAVSSAHPIATEAGLEILRRGGNVIDAAIAVSFALGVVEPDASGVGGYGQMLIYRPGMSDPELIEFMTRVPEDAGIGWLPDDGRGLERPARTNVPGTVAAMHLAWRKHGSRKLAWADLLAPAIRAARDGYTVSDGLATTLATEREHYERSPGAVALFFRDGEPVRAGDTVKNPDLAWVLEQIATGGADGFYRGEVARRMVDDLRRFGSPMKLSDLARYFAAERAPVSGTYRGHTIYSSTPPVAGGATLVAQLNLLEQWPAPKLYTDDAATLHAMISAWQLTPSSRNRIADPSLWPVDVAPIVDKDTARIRWSCFDPTRALPPESFRGAELTCASDRGPVSADSSGPGARTRGRSGGADIEVDGAGGGDGIHSTGTTAFAVADADGNVVAVTQTLGTWGGTFHVTPGLGFLYNDKLFSYSSDPDAYGARLPFARHGSTIAPTIVFEGSGASKRPVLAVGAAGNAWITSAVFQTLVGVVDFGLGPQEALELPRFLVGGRGGGGARGATVSYEDGFAPDVVRALSAMGYRVQPISLAGELRMGYGAAVVIGPRSVTAGGDPRRGAGAGAVR